MHIGAKQRLLLQALLFSMLLISACENDLKKINELSAKQSSDPVQKTTGVDVIYSDSAKVKLRLLAPLLLQFQDVKDQKKSFDKMPKGIKVIFYDTTRQESGSIIADTGINHSFAKLMEFHKNVVVTNAQGETFKSEELIWDQTKKIIYSNKHVQMTMKGGDVVYGDNFISNEQLTHPQFGKGTGTFHVTEMQEN